MNTTYKSNNNVVYSCKYHVVWCPKYRRKVLTNGVDTRLKELLTEYAANLSVEILEMEIMPDHVHMLLEVDPQFGIHKAVKTFKGYTSGILRQEFPYLKTIAIPENNAKNSALQNVNSCVTDFRRTPVRLQIRSL